MAGGVGCLTGQNRICVDEPASSLFATKTLDTPGNLAPSIAFASWSTPDLQLILRWIASGAPRGAAAGSCGDRIVQTGEECDEGTTPPEHCPYGTASCTLCNAQCKQYSGTGSVCGDGVVDAGYETCDDGNTTIDDVGAYGGPSCGPGCTYVSGVVCGGDGQTCCQHSAAACGKNSKCQGTVCEPDWCGDEHQPCCPHAQGGNTCMYTYDICDPSSDTCVQCGGLYQPCCAHSTCQPPSPFGDYTCSSGYCY